MTDRRRGFSLIELSIVLVIIGLIVGGVLAGKSLIKAQGMRNALEDAKTYAIAIQLFQDKYGALPGDMPDATRIWGNAEGGAATANCNTPETSVSTGKPTCNGNGNGIIEYAGSEAFRAWQQLAAAEYVAIGNMTGVHGAGGIQEALPGVNVPRGGLDSSGFTLSSEGVIDSSDMNYFEGDYNNVLMFGKTVGTGPTMGQLLLPAEAYEMDKKVDDSRPGLGYVRSDESGGCANGTDPLTAQYALSEETPKCFLFFLHGFQAKPQ